MSTTGAIPSCVMTPFGLHSIAAGLDNYVTYYPDGTIESAKFDTLVDGSYLFAYHVITSIPEGVTFASVTIGSRMFRDCSSLTSLPASMTLGSLTDGSSMFSGCSKLTSLPTSMTLGSLTDGSNMFRDCTSLTTADCTLILNALPTYTSGSRTITLPNTDAAKAADATIGTDKGWTVAYS